MMQPLIDIFGQLEEEERTDFTSWFSKLTPKERERVAAVFAKTSIERIRTLLSVPEDQRIALFLVQRNPWDSTSEKSPAHSFREAGLRYFRKSIGKSEDD